MKLTKPTQTTSPVKYNMKMYHPSTKELTLVLGDYINKGRLYEGNSGQTDVWMLFVRNDRCLGGQLSLCPGYLKIMVDTCPRPWELC